MVYIIVCPKSAGLA